jgi:hypothetical protein
MYAVGAKRYHSEETLVSTKKGKMGGDLKYIREMKMKLNTLFCANTTLSKLNDLDSYKSKIILSGNTSTGKSSVTNAIIGQTIFPSGRKVVTKVPQLLYLVPKNGSNHTYEIQLIENNRSKPIEREKISVKEERDVTEHLNGIFRRYDNPNYDHQVNIGRLVDEPSYFHVLDLPGTGTLEGGPGEIMMGSPNNINVIVLGYYDEVSLRSISLSSLSLSPFHLSFSDHRGLISLV